VKLVKKQAIEDLKVKTGFQKNTQGFEKLSKTTEKTVTSFLENIF
jgi:hypothetical protein